VDLPYLFRSNPSLPVADETVAPMVRELRRDVETLAVDIGPRGTYDPRRYKLAEDFLGAALARSGYRVARQTFEAMGVPCSNIEVAIPGTVAAEKILVVGAHYDTVEGCPGANDNSSGVAAVLAIARAMANDRPRCTVKFVLFANEEPPFFNMDEMGSQIYARRCGVERNDLRMVCLETIGCYSREKGSQRWPLDGLDLMLPDTGNFIALVGAAASGRLIRLAAEAFEAQGAFAMLAAAAPASTHYLMASDHRGFNEAGYEAFMVTDTAPFRYPHYHEASDTPDKIDFDSMARVVKGLIGTVRELAAWR
jgi:Zn-dependent M28 family amino/carboxypeptidase